MSENGSDQDTKGGSQLNQSTPHTLQESKNVGLFRRIRKFLKKPVVWIVLVVAGLVAAIIKPQIQNVGDDFLNSLYLRDRFASGPVLNISEPGDIPGPMGPYFWVARSALKKNPDDSLDFDTLSDIGVSSYEFDFSSNRYSPVSITNISIVNRRCRQALTNDLIEHGYQGGGGTKTVLSANLAGRLLLLDADGDPYFVGGKARSLTLDPKGPTTPPLTVLLTVSAAKEKTCDWQLKLDYLIHGDKRSFTLPRQFSTSAILKKPNSYDRMWVLKPDLHHVSTTYDEYCLNKSSRSCLTNPQMIN